MAVLYQTYRPGLFKDVTGQPHVVQTIQNQVGSGSLAHAYVFTGPRGVGKTTMARLLAKVVNCENVLNAEPCNSCSACASIASGQALDIHEIDAASHTDVDNVRENIIKAVQFAPAILKKKVYIIDEVHMLSTSSFNALLKTLEEPPEHALFILATTEIHKVPETIISRCQRFDFLRISKDAIVNRLKMIVEAEGVTIDDSVLEQIARHSTGCARDAESLLGQVLAIGEKNITAETAGLVLPSTNSVAIQTFVDHLKAGETKSTIESLNTFVDQGMDLSRFVDDVIEYLRDEFMSTFEPKLRVAIECLLDARIGTRGDFLPQLSIELAIVDLCDKFVERSTGEVGPQATQIPDVSEPEDFSDRGVVSNQIVTTTDNALESIESIESVEKVFDAVPVLDIDVVRKKWPEVFEQIKACHASLPLLMNTAEVCDVHGGNVELAFDYELHVQAVNREKNRKLIEQVLERVLGQQVKVKAVKSKRQAEETAVLDLAEQFGGTVV